MSVQKRTWKSGGKAKTAWRVKWEDSTGWQSKTFDRKADADAFDADIGRRRRLGTLAQLDAGTETLDSYMTETWVPTFAALVAPKTRRTYAGFYATHLARTFGNVPLRDLTPELIGRWQTDRLAAGAGPVAVRQSLSLLGNVLSAPPRPGESRRTPRGSCVRRNSQSAMRSDLWRPRPSRRCARSCFSPRPSRSSRQSRASASARGTPQPFKPRHETPCWSA